MFLADFVRNVYIPRRLLKPASVAAIQDAILAVERLLGHRPSLDDAASLLPDIAAMQVRRGLSRATGNRQARTLAAILRMAWRRGLIATEPKKELLPEAHRNPEAWSAADVACIVATAERLGEQLTRAYVFAVYETGLRIGDVYYATTYDSASGVVRVQERKTGQYRAFVLSEPARRAIAQVCAQPEGGLLPRPWTNYAPLSKRLRRVLRAADLQHGRRDLWQKLRRTVATLASGAGLDATAVLGHSARWVTQTFYIDKRQASPLDVASHLPPITLRPAH